MTKHNTIYFLGIGGIGMSAIAHYYLQKGDFVFGYDLQPTAITSQLSENGAVIHFTEDVNLIPPNVDFVIYTPAIPKQHLEYQYFINNKIPLFKRSEILGHISDHYPTMAISGTHGKTTTTALVSHLLYPQNNIMSFIGGISKNFNSNFVLCNPVENVVVEADEFDHSFLTLHPQVAAVTSMDADHLDIYHDTTTLIESFQLFAHQVSHSLIVYEKIASRLTHPNIITYGLSPSCSYFIDSIEFTPYSSQFNLHFNDKVWKNIQLGISGLYNVLNATAAIAIVMEMSKINHSIIIDENNIRQKTASFSGVKRRFDYQIITDDLIYIDDYAHHPEELRAIISAVKQIYPSKQITGIFQPHLYTRTRDFAPQFAEVLALLDEVILLDIYPARELPIQGITSSYLLDLIPISRKSVLPKEQVIDYLIKNHPQVLLTMGAGNIDQLVPQITTALSKE